MLTRTLTLRRKLPGLRLLVLPTLICAVVLGLSTGPAAAAYTSRGAYYSPAGVLCDPAMGRLEVTTSAYSEPQRASQYVAAHVAIYRNGLLAYHYETKPWIAMGTNSVGNQLTVWTGLGAVHGQWQVSIKYRWWLGSYWSPWSPWQTTTHYVIRDYSPYPPIVYGYCYV